MLKQILRMGRRSGVGDAGDQQPGARQAAYRSRNERRAVQAPSDRLCAVTDTGRARERNEDAFYLSEDGCVMAVADGMGGHQAGDVASNLALAAVADYLTADRLATRASEEETGASLLAEAIEVAHRRVLEAGDQSTTEPRMGATLILARVVGDHLHTCHVGDVRCYLRTATGLVQITRDHSVVGSLVQNGQLTPEQARAHPNRHEVLQAVGMPLSIQPETHVMKLSAGDRVILCSDGLWEAIADSEIAEIVDWDGTMRQRAMQLVDRANEAGGHDNITVVLYEHELGRARRS